MIRGVLWYKIKKDLLGNKSRTLQVILIIAIGSAAIGTIIGATEFIRQDVAANWQAASPASIVLELGNKGVTQDVIEVMENSPLVDKVEGRLRDTILWRFGPDEPWQRANFHAREDYEDMKLYTLRLEAGDWPRNKTLTVNRGYGIETGDQIEIQIDDRVRQVDIGGVTWRISALPPNLGGRPTFFATKEYFSELTGIDKYDFISASAPGPYSNAATRAAAASVEDDLKAQDVEVYPGTFENTKTTDPNLHPIQGAIDGVFFILQVMAFASLILGLFLVFNTITAIINQQVPQIGVLKAIGATRSKVLLLYYTVVLFYGLGAIIISIPLGAAAAHGLRVFIVEFLGMDAGPFALSPQAILIQMAICILSPLLIATLPIVQGAQITVYQAMITYGLTGGGGLVDRLLTKLAFVNRIFLMAISNTFRNKLRLVMTQITLIGAGVLFMAVMSVQSSIRFTYGELLFETFQTDILLIFDETERVGVVERLIRRADPNVDNVEMWAAVRANVRLAGQPPAFDDRTIKVTGMPIPSAIYQPQMRAGRWLQPGDEHVLVIHQSEAEDLGVTVGDWVTLDIPLKGEADWEVIGLLFDPLDDRRVVAPRETLLFETHRPGQADELLVRTGYTSPAQNDSLAGLLRQNFDRHGYEVRPSDNTDTLQLTSNKVMSELDIVIYLLLLMAVLIAIVGGIALSGALAINVLERRVEIGIMRAIGASSRHVATIFIGEGVLISWLSWLIAVPLSLPASIALSAAVGSALGNELVFKYAVISVGIWWVIITLLGIAASWFPARGAIQVSVRDSLTYQ